MYPRPSTVSSIELCSSMSEVRETSSDIDCILDLTCSLSRCLHHGFDCLSKRSSTAAQRRYCCIPLGHCHQARGYQRSSKASRFSFRANISNFCYLPVLSMLWFYCRHFQPVTRISMLVSFGSNICGSKF